MFLYQFILLPILVKSGDAINLDEYTSYDPYPVHLQEDEYLNLPDHILTRTDTKEFNSGGQCSTSGKMSIVRVNLHFDDFAIKSIVSASYAKLNMILDELNAVKAYIGTIFNELNSDLIRYGIQIATYLDHYRAEDLLITDGFDFSCEVKDPILDRTSKSFEQLKGYSTNNMGIHQFIWSCPKDNKNFMISEIYKNGVCGNVIGLLWQGGDITSLTIKSSLLEALLGIPELYLDGRIPTNEELLGTCKFAGDCIGESPSIIGFRNHEPIQLVHVIPAEDAGTHTTLVHHVGSEHEYD